MCVCWRHAKNGAISLHKSLLNWKDRGKKMKTTDRPNLSWTELNWATRNTGEKLKTLFTRFLVESRIISVYKCTNNYTSNITNSFLFVSILFGLENYASTIFREKFLCTLMCAKAHAFAEFHLMIFIIFGVFVSIAQKCVRNL